MGQWDDGEMGRRGDGAMGRWGDGENVRYEKDLDLKIVRQFKNCQLIF